MNKKLRLLDFKIKPINVDLEWAVCYIPIKDSALDVASNVATFCHRGDSAVPLVLTYERKDVLKREAGRWKIARRLVLLDTTVLGLESLSIFL